LLEESILVAGRHGAQTGTTIRVERACELPPFRMDPDQLRQIFENLLINATEAAGEDGNVAVEIERIVAADESDETDPGSDYDEFVVIHVCDDGPGIAPETSDRIFHPFFTTKPRGSGVGLSTVKRIVDNHGGLIDVDRGALGGARFTVRLPMILAKHDHEVPQQ
jgi:signal transduction histidine kinase